MHAYVHANPTHLILFYAVSPFSYRVGTLQVVENRAVIEIQSYVRFVEAKGIIPRGLPPRKVSRQIQCHAAPQHYLALFESASCKNSEASCLV